jgi:hypothetical protein
VKFWIWRVAPAEPFAKERWQNPSLLQPKESLFLKNFSLLPQKNSLLSLTGNLVRGAKVVALV